MFSISKESSDTINILKCILAIGVVMIHIRLSVIEIDGENILLNGQFDSFNTFYRLIMIFLRVCVPVYFMISGFLFFMKAPEKPNISFFKESYKKRIRSLLIPYLIGNIIAIFLFVIGEKFIPNIMGGGHQNISDYSFPDILMSFWRMPGNMDPINQVLWFLRDLMVMILLSPVFYWLIKKTDYWCLILFFLNYIFEGTRDIPGFRPVAIFFFSFGAFFSIKGEDIFTNMKKYVWYLLAAYILLFFIASITELNYIKNLSVVAGVPVVTIIVYYLVKRCSWTFDTKWIAATFFLYIYHNFPVTVVKKLLIMLIHPTSSLDCLIIYFVTGIIVVVVMLVLYFLLKKLMPRTMALVVGGK